jgi:hypothetical protein
MTPNKTDQQLTSEQLDSLLFRGDASELSSTLADLRIATSSVAEQARLNPKPSPRKLTGFAWSFASTFAAAALMLCIYVPRIAHHPQPNTPPVLTAQQTTPTISDDVLLADVQNDLAESVPTPMLPLTTTTTKSTTRNPQ